MSNADIATPGSSWRQPLAATVLTLVVGFILVALVSDRPVAAYEQLILGNFSSTANFANLLNRVTPVLLIGLGVVFAFRAGIFNVGGEGQLFLGAIASAALAIKLPDLPGPVMVLTCLLGGIVAGAFWAWIPGVLKVRFEVDEVVTTLMLNFVATLLTSYLVAGVLRDKDAYGAVSVPIQKSAWLPALPGLPQADWGVVLALVAVVASWVVLFRTVWGASLRAAGTNARFAESVGVKAGRDVIAAMMVSGAFAGLAGAVYVLGTGHRFEQNFSPGLGLIGLTVALMGREHPFGVLLASIFYAMMLNGSALMQLETDVPRSLVDLITGVLVLLMTVELGRRVVRRRRVRQESAS